MYVAPFSVGAPSTGKRLVSGGGGSHPEWSRDGEQLYYLAADKRIMTVAVDTNKLLAMADEIKQFIADNQDKLKVKEG